MSYVRTYKRTIEIPQRTHIVQAKERLNLHNVPLKLPCLVLG